MPVHWNKDHWLLVKILPPTKTVEIMDSLPLHTGPDGNQKIFKVWFAAHTVKTSNAERKTDTIGMPAFLFWLEDDSQQRPSFPGKWC